CALHGRGDWGFLACRLRKRCQAPLRLCSPYPVRSVRARIWLGVPSISKSCAGDGRDAVPSAVLPLSGLSSTRRQKIALAKGSVRHESETRKKFCEEV